MPAGAVRGLLALFLLTALLSLAGTLAGGSLPAAWGWLEGLVGLLAAMTLLASLARRLPLQNALACGVVLGATSAMVLALAVHTRVPLGRLEFGGGLGPRFFGLVPWPIPFLCLATLLASRQSARLLLRPWRRHPRYGWLLLAVAVGLSVLLAAVLDPFGHRVKGWWTWPPGNGLTTWSGAPWEMLPATAALAGGLLLCATAWLIPKRPTAHPLELDPALVWVTLAVWAGMGCLRGGLLLPALTGLGAAVAVAWLGWRGKQAGAVTPAAAPDGAPASAG